MPNQKQNLCNRPNFEEAMKQLQEKYPNTKFTIDNIWMDFGAGMRWDTIIAENERNASYGGYQILCPRDWDILQNASNKEEITKLVTTIIQDQHHLLK